jgi:DNA-binding MarR family transcriptional regulator
MTHRNVRMKRETAALARRRAPEADPLPELPARDGDALLGPLGEFIGFHLRLAQDASFRAFARHAGLRDLKPGRFAAMMVIHNNPGISQIELSRAIARDKSSVTPLIQDLEKHGFVQRLQSKADKRRVTLALTCAGETMLRRLLVHAADHDRKLDEIVGEAKPELIRLLKMIADALA